MTYRRRVLVVTPTSWEEAAITSPALQERYEFIVCGKDLVENPTWWDALHFDVLDYLNTLAHRYSGEKLDGVMGTGDYPGCMFSAWLAQALHLPGPDPRVVVNLSHKLHSRTLQAKYVPEATPSFALLRSARHPLPPNLGFPVFVKPVKGTMSIRATLTHTPQELRRALSFSLREKVWAWTVLRPFLQLLSHYGDTHTRPWDFVGEAPLSGVQVTVDGFVEKGKVTIMGIVDSVMYPGTMSFQRFEYPSSLPPSILARMGETTTQFVKGTGLDQTCFNVELFYDAEQDKISIIEINPRMSYQFSDLYQHVDGTSTFDIQLALATGQDTRWLPGAGADRAAASFVERRFEDAKVLQTPSEDEISEVRRLFPTAHLEILCHPGELLSDHKQDVSSYRYCITNLSAPSREELFRRYEHVLQILTFKFQPLGK